MSFPYSTLKGLFPPFHILVGVTVVVEDMGLFKISMQIYYELFKKGQ
jgi:hypothetical protein